MVWLWAIALIASCEVIQFEGPNDQDGTFRRTFALFLAQFELWQVWMAVGMAVLCQLAASAGFHKGIERKVD